MAPTTPDGTDARLEKLRLNACSILEALRRASDLRAELVHAVTTHDAVVPAVEEFYYDTVEGRVVSVAVRPPTSALGPLAEVEYHVAREVLSDKEMDINTLLVALSKAFSSIRDAASDAHTLEAALRSELGLGESISAASRDYAIHGVARVHTAARRAVDLSVEGATLLNSLRRVITNGTHAGEAAHVFESLERLLAPSLLPLSPLHRSVQ